MILSRAPGRHKCPRFGSMLLSPEAPLFLYQIMNGGRYHAGSPAEFVVVAGVGAVVGVVAADGGQFMAVRQDGSSAGWTVTKYPSGLWDSMLLIWSPKVLPNLT